MSKLSKDLESIKNEFQNDEKLLENAFKLERFFKKYKFVLLGIVSINILWVQKRLAKYMMNCLYRHKILSCAKI